MSILRKPLDAILVSDLDALVEAEARETNDLEFKGTLPFKPEKGQPQTADRWIEKGDRIGPYARDQILAEIVAFANAEGGTLVLGLHETRDHPRRAERLEPLPKCEELARRLIDATEDTIEPRLAMVEAKALPVDEAGAGYVVMRVGKSLMAPHRLTTTREFYIRRGERAAVMDVREIRDLTLNLARTGTVLIGYLRSGRLK
jgi:predicted HTH transcriptional regulator